MANEELKGTKACPRCGRTIRASSVYCKYCQKPVRTDVQG